MAYRSRSRSGGRSSKRGSYLWQTASVDPSTLTAGSKFVVDLLPNVDRNVLARATVVRMIGDWGVKVQSDDSDTQVVAGIYVGTEEERSAGQSMEPETDLVDYLYLASQIIFMGARLENADQWIMKAIDNRSKRKMRNSESELLMVFENVLAVTATIQFFMRILLRLP